jgi:RNA polymerase sigma factor (TIGR02999 family)
VGVVASNKWSAVVPQTALFRVLEAGKLEDRQSLDDLFTSFYDELHRRAKWELRQNRPPSLGPTTLLHETFLDMSNRDSVPFADCRQFIAYAARAMRGLIINHFRNRQALKRGGRLEFTPLTTDVRQAEDGGDALALEGLGEALESLATIDSRLAECVDMKFFCGLSFSEIAKLREVSERTVQRDWDKARLLLNQLIKDHRDLPKSA